MGALVTSTLTASDLDAVRDIAADRTTAATVVAHAFSWIGSGFVVFPVALVCCLELYRRGRRAAALAVALSTVGAQLIIDLDKLLVGRHRPPLRYPDRVTGHSFPSAHTGQTAALCAVLLLEASAGREVRRELRVAAVAGSSTGHRPWLLEAAGSGPFYSAMARTQTKGPVWRPRPASAESHPGRSRSGRLGWAKSGLIQKVVDADIKPTLTPDAVQR